MTTYLCCTVLLVGSAVLPMAAQNDSGVPGTPVRTVVTVEPKKKKGPPPNLSMQDVLAYEGRTRDKVTGWVHLTGAHASLEFLILLDDDAGLGLDIQLNDIRNFINAQPDTTAIAVGYMRNGTVLFTSPFTKDHQQAAQSIRLPIGMSSIDGSPYFSLSDVAKRWQSGGAERREVLMVTDGIDRYGVGTGLDDPYVNTAISDAQKAGIIVYSIYVHGEGHFGHSFWMNNWGQNFLSEVSESTGGESFWIGFGNPVSFKPYLDDLSVRLNGGQFMATIIAQPKDKAELRPIKLHTEVPNADLAYPQRIWVPAGK
jgi:hypothetical protein